MVIFWKMDQNYNNANNNFLYNKMVGAVCNIPIPFATPFKKMSHYFFTIFSKVKIKCKYCAVVYCMAV